MRKTFLKVALIGLLVGSLPVGFTSCKDYDDDIENTNNQVADLKTKLASVETAIAALPSKADVTAAQAAAVAQAKADLEAVKAELQKAIDGKADKEAVEAISTELSKIQGQLETIEALKADVATALEAVSKVTTLEEKAEAQGQLIAGIQAQIAELTKNGATQFAALTEELNALKTAVNDPTNGLDALKKQVAELADKIQGEGGDAASLEATLKVVNGMVTSLRIVEDWGAANRNNLYGWVYNDDWDVTVQDRNTIALQLYNPVPVENTPVGPKGEALLFDMKKGDQKDFTDSLLVQVSPAGATLTQEQLTLVNSQLKEIKDFVVISNVRAYNKADDILTSRAASSNGLYVVYFTQNPTYDWEKDAEQAEENETATDFAKATQANEGKGNKIRFAIALNETNEGGSRDVMTPYNIVVNGGAIRNSMTLSYNVDQTSVANIHNRFLYAADGSSFMYKESEVTNAFENMPGTYAKATAIANYNAAVAQGYAPVGDYAWYKGNEVIAYPARYTNAPYNDDRTSKPFYPVEMGEDFVVSLNNLNGPVYGYYVAIDTYRATESGESEIAAWTKYAENIAGINKVYTSGNITLNIAKAANVPAGDVIGFRVWAVNYDGTLVDPDGRAFYVQVGDAAAVATTAISATIPATVAKDGKTPFFPVATVASYDDILGWTTAYSEVEVSFAMENAKYLYQQADPDAVVTVNLGGIATLTSTMAGKGSKQTVEAADYAAMFKNIEISIASAKFVDNQTYNGTITIKGTSTGGSTQVVQKIPVTIKKTIPSAIPSYFTVAAGLSNDIANINVYANAGSVSAGITVPFDNIFRWDNKALNTASDLWGKFAFLVKLADATQATWAKPGDKAYYTNWIYNNGTNPTLTFVGLPYQNTTTTTGSETYQLNDGPWYNLLAGTTTGYLATKTTKIIPTLDVINGGVQILSIYYLYPELSFVSPDRNNGNISAANKKAAEPKTVVGTANKTLRVQTYANTYSISTTSMPQLAFSKGAAVNFDAVTITSSATSQVKNATLTALQATTVADYLRIKDAKFALTGDAAEYFEACTVEINGTTNRVEVASSNGAVTVAATLTLSDGTSMSISGYPVSGVAVKNTAAANATPNYTWATSAPEKVVIFVPNDKMVNAPAGNLTGALTLTYTDFFGLGSKFEKDENGSTKIVPYSKDYNVTMIP